MVVIRLIICGIIMTRNAKQMNETPSSPGHVTIHDVAARLGVSATTVWNAVNNRGRISPQNRQKILAVVRQMGYRPSMVAQTLSGGKTRLIGVVVPMVGGNPFTPMVHAVEKVAAEQDYNIILCDTEARVDREEKYLDQLIRRRIEGLVIVPSVQADLKRYDHLVRLESLGIAVVVIEQDIPDRRLTRIVPDNRGDARRMTEHLLELGHRRIGFFQAEWPKGNIAALERLEGYKQAIQAAGFKFDPALMVDAGGWSLNEDAPVPAELKHYLKSSRRPTAIFANNDGIAIGTVAMLRRMNIRVPDEMAVVGFDDHFFSGFFTPPLTTVRQPDSRVGARAAQLLLERLSGRQNEQIWPLHERISGELIIRESCGCKCKSKKQ
jgi:DNA-binding LacI/PurR family transcriptional regulator